LILKRTDTAFVPGGASVETTEASFQGWVGYTPYSAVRE
jgi:hypothetical protein